MEDEQLTTSPSLQEMILEYAWTHKIKDLQEVVEASFWMETRQQYRSLKETWRLRVASAQAYSILKSRDVGRYERVIAFLEASHSLLPTLVVAIKHMKIMFGLKTLVIMWMLKQGHGLVPIMVKIVQFFPSTLPQYQDHCSKKEICLMQKNHVDFKLFAQNLAMDKIKLKDYIKDQLEEQYGDHYTRKVEDRLLHYIHKLEKMLPSGTYIDQILRREHSVSYEEKMLLEIIAGGSMPISTSLRTVLLWGGKGVCPGKDLLNPAPADCVGLVDLAEAAVNISASRAPPRSEPPSNAPATAPQDITRQPRSPCLHLSQDSPLLFVMEDEGDGGLVRGTVEGEGKKGDGGNIKRGPVLTTAQEERAVSQRDEGAGEEQHRELQLSQRSPEVTACSYLPQFCTKHQRWVRSFLSECSKDLPMEGDVPRVTSPLLFPSSASSSSQDLTPSGLVSCHLLQTPAAEGLEPPEEVLALNTASQSAHPLCSSTLRSKSSRTWAPNPSTHTATPTRPPVHECASSDEEATKPGSPSNSPDLNPSLHAGLSPDGANPPMVFAIAAPARTLSVHHEQTTSGGLSPPGHTARATEPSSGLTAPGRCLRLRRAHKQEPVPLHTGPSESSKHALASSARPPSANLYTATAGVATVSISVLSSVPRPAPPGSQCTPESPPQNVSAEDPRPPAQVSLQPYVRLARLLPQQYLSETIGRVPPSTETLLPGKHASGGPHGEGAPGEEEEEEEEEGGAEKFLSFDPNLLFSSDDSSGSDCGDPEDLEYVPSKPKGLKRWPI